ncbi:hypothetical protein M758_UG127200 [Ceratodon purpureus]|nr:hypothetical protein M758_UG127200 [Ceratodon purpureus]
MDYHLFCLKGFLIYYIHIYYYFGNCRYSNLKYHVQRPFFCNPDFYPSPPKSCQLPSYADGLAIQLAEGQYRTSHSPQTIPRKLDYVDIKAAESDTVASSKDESINLLSFLELGSSFITESSGSETVSSSHCQSPQPMSK